MGKLVTLKIGEGNNDSGYPVTLQIAQEYPANDHRILLHPQVETMGKLPPAADILQDYRNWQQSYRDLALNSRLEAKLGQTKNVSIVGLMSTCQSAAQRSLNSFNRWLNADSLQSIRENLASLVTPNEPVRIVLQIADPQLHRLPWQVGDIFTRYSLTEVVLTSPQKLEPIHQLNSLKSRVKILAILGNSQGINVEADRKILENLPNAEVEFLVEPQRQALNDRLWEQPWDILFFAGHSSSSDDDATGIIYINQTDSLTLTELRYGLKKAIARGLKIAIFNSCDGLGLAKSLSDLQIPQVIVMREPVPDRVAQTFLAAFLELYAQGNSFYRSVREAREKLQGLEDKFPCATWLPTIYQQWTNYPPTWKQLQGAGNAKKHQLKTALIASLGTAIAIAALRSIGIFQPLELSTFDLTMRSRPGESTKDGNMLVIEVTKEDKKSEWQSGSSLSDENLNRLLARLIPLAPRIIGIDNYLSHPIDPKYTSIHNSLQSGELVAVCKTQGASKIQDPTEADQAEQPPPAGAIKVGFGDTIADEDIARRHLLSMDSSSNSPGASCNSPWALSTILAYNYLYLEPREIKLKIVDDTLQFGNRQSHPILRKFSQPSNFQQYLTARTGGYQRFDFDDRGYQILLNYRSFNNSLKEAIPAISLRQALALPTDKLQAAVRDKLILIGTTDANYGDIITTPYGKIPGVFHQAQMTSQIINAALVNRPLFWAAPFWVDGLIILLCSTTGGLLAWAVRDRWLLIGLGCGSVAILYVGSVVVLAIFGYWFPLVPALLGLVITVICVKISLGQATKSPVITHGS
jgi:CHASE2 domain-containing sensor protein